MGGRGSFPLKLDMSKAYDQVKCHFVEVVRLKLGFQRDWMSLIMRCAQILSYSIGFNGKPMGFIVPGKGLRQKDPFSPFLLLYCTKRLFTLLRMTLRNGDIKGSKANRARPIDSNLFFVDDIMIFDEASITKAKNVKGILVEYEACSGQLINYDKSLIYFSSNVLSKQKLLIEGELSVRCSLDPERYLGLPMVVGRNKKVAFHTI